MMVQARHKARSPASNAALSNNFVRWSSAAWSRGPSASAPAVGSVQLWGRLERAGKVQTSHRQTVIVGPGGRAHGYSLFGGVAARSLRSKRLRAFLAPCSV